MSGTRGGKGNSTPKSVKKKGNAKGAKKPDSSDTKLAEDIRYDKCPCGKSDDASWMIKCTRCPQDWHSNCVNLKGITADFVTQLEDWLSPLCFTAPGAIIRDNQRLEEIMLQMAEIRGHNTSIQTSIVALENRLGAVASDIDSVRDTQGHISQKVLTIKDIESHMQHQLVNQTQIETRLKSINSSLTSLQSQVNDYQATVSACPPPSTATPTPLPAPAFVPSPDPMVPPPHGMSPSSPLSVSFIDEDSAKSITEFLETCTFNDENGHSVISFGHPYSYTGSKSSSDVPPIPAALQPLFDKINELQSKQFLDKYPHLQDKYPAPCINACLVNKYNGPDSYLPKHSDKETTIPPESSIFTVSLGQACDIQFTEKSTGNETTLTCPDRSLYHMTRKSQDFFEHRIDKGSVTSGVRYSLTFRSVDWKNRNSTCLIGDSNTGQLKFGSSKHGSFGELMPGQRFWAATIEKINPLDCCAYNNIVVMCGINDLKDERV